MCLCTEGNDVLSFRVYSFEINLCKLPFKVCKRLLMWVEQCKGGVRLSLGYTKTSEDSVKARA